MSLLSACGLRNRELGFGARRCCYSAQLRSSKGFGIQETLWNLTESNLSVPLGPARMDPFPLRGRLDRQPLPGVSWARAGTSQEGGEDAVWGWLLMFWEPRGNKGSLRLGGPAETPPALKISRLPASGFPGQPWLQGIRTNSSGGLRRGSGREGSNRWPGAAERLKARTGTGVQTAGSGADRVAKALSDLRHFRFRGWGEERSQKVFPGSPRRLVSPSESPLGPQEFLQ